MLVRQALDEFVLQPTQLQQPTTAAKSKSHALFDFIKTQVTDEFEKQPRKLTKLSFAFREYNGFFQVGFTALVNI